MPDKHHELNRSAWNEIVDIHINHSEYRVLEFIDGGHTLKRIELEALGDVTGKTLLHLMCQFGLDTLSWARQGAIVTGVDISDQSILRANELVEKSGVKGTFVRSDVLDLIGVLDQKYDIVFQSYGTHVWISDIFKWAEVVAHYLKPGGTFLIVDEHPANVMFMDPPFDYFMKEPDITPNAPDYCDKDFKIKGTLVEWQHPLSKIINALISAGLVIDHVGEYPHGFWCQDEGWTEDEEHYWWPPGGPAKYPVMMSIRAHKPNE